MTLITGKLSPDAILESTNWSSGTVANIQDDPASPDSSWMVATTNSSPVLRVSFPTIASITSLDTTANSQTFNVWCRASGNASAGQKIQIQLYQNGTLVSSGTATTVSNATGQLVSYTWTPSANDDSSNVECRLVITGVSSGSRKGSVDVGAVSWSYSANKSDIVMVTIPNGYVKNSRTLQPSAITGINLFTPNDVTYLQDSPSSPDVNNLTVTGNTSNPWVDLKFPTQYLTGTQKIKVAFTDDPTYIGLKVLVYEGGILRSTSTALYGGSGEIQWDASILASPTSQNVVIRIQSTLYPATNGKTIQNLKAVEWNATTMEADANAPNAPTNIFAEFSTVSATVTDLDNNPVKISITYSTTSNFSSNVKTIDSTFVASGSTATVTLDSSSFVDGQTIYLKITANDGYLNSTTINTSYVYRIPVNDVVTPTNLFPFNGSAWKNAEARATVTSSDGGQIKLVIECSLVSDLSSGVSTRSSAFVNSGTTVTVSLADVGFASGAEIYWRAYTSNDAYNSTKTPIYHFTYTPSGGNFSTATKFMQQGSSAQYAKMLDVSSIQGTVDFVKLKNTDGINYVILRAYGSDHSGNGDTMFETNVANAKSAGVLTGAYFYAMPSVPLDLNQAHREADLFIAKLQAGYGTGQYGDLTPMVDVENNTAYATTGQGILNLSVTDMLTWVNEFRNYFTQQTGRKLGLYTSDDFVHDQRSNFNEDETTGLPLAGTQGNIIKDMPLWCAGWNTYARYKGGVMPQFGGWTEWQAYQYGDTSTDTSVVLTSTTHVTDLSWVKPIEWISPPKKLTGLTATDSGANVNLTWTASSEQDVNNWDIYVDGNKVGSSTTDGSYALSGVSAGQHTIEVRPIDNFGDKPISPTTITYTFNGGVVGSPSVTINDVTHYIISDEVGFNSTDIKFVFDKDVQAWTVNVNGVSFDSGTIADSSGSGGTSTTVGTASTWTVSFMATKPVSELSSGGGGLITAGTEIQATIDWTELYQEGDNRVNIYGQSTDGSWTPYDDGTLPDGGTGESGGSDTGGGTTGTGNTVTIPSGMTVSMYPTWIVDATGGWVGQSLTDITDDPTTTSTDSTRWSVGTSDSTVDTHVTLGLDALTTPLVGTQKLQVGYYKNNGYTISLTAKVMQNGIVIAEQTIQPAMQTEGYVEITFDASLLSDNTGTGLEAYVSTTYATSNQLGITLYWRVDLSAVRFILHT